MAIKRFLISALYIGLSAAIAMPLAAQSTAAQPAPTNDGTWHPTLPDKDNYADFLAYATHSHPIPDGFLYFDSSWDAFGALASAGRWEAVWLLAKAFHDSAPDGPYNAEVSFPFKNPISLAYKAQKFDLVKRLLGLGKGLLNLSDGGVQSSDLDPLATVVANNDRLWAKTFLDAGANPATNFVEHRRDGYESWYPSNLLSISPSKEMDDFLLAAKVPAVFSAEFYKPATINDDNVRFRAAPNTQGKVLASLSKGDIINAIACTYKIYQIGEYKGRWVKASFKGQTGWVLQAFLDGPFWDEL